MSSSRKKKENSLSLHHGHDITSQPCQSSSSIPSPLPSTHRLSLSLSVTGIDLSDDGRVARLAAQQAVVIFSSSTCCMCHAIKSLFQDLGVNYTQPPPRRLRRREARWPTDRVMALHLAGKLAPLLSDAGAKWL
ncbi:unnamed protein product [Spirodela intermedia]|uniref:Glutaredoxin domain-containing protein n=1 Tax=Spirodela intermedia TaxID=51605 RepID=A0A7I8J0H6_SPIIN|nr:unnamed protein product [Spirodela intermedia]CAA6663462.1 unnamed protein product [Spirodela intermedia]